MNNAGNMGVAVSHSMVTTLCVALSAGVFLTVLSRRVHVPAIILLLLGGVALGPEWLNVVRPEGLGEFLQVVISLSVGLILFEGGLTLDIAGYRQGSRVIKQLLTVGVLVTWLLSAFFFHRVFRAGAGVALLAGSLVIVTGPTVIGPLLKRIQITPRLHNILHWEGVLIDSIGVFIALLCFEWLIGGAGDRALANFATRVLSGLTIGILGGLATAFMLRTRFVADEMKNGFALASAVAIFGAAEAVIAEGGLLSVTIAGLVVGWKQPLGLKRVREFKAEITDLLIGLLFVLLAARLDTRQFLDFGLTGLIAVALVMLVVRPLNVFLSSRGSDLTIREIAFLAWVAPRGIVAASMSSLFALALSASGATTRPRLIETFTWSVIVATVVIQGLSAGAVARLLRLRRPVPTGWLIVGAHFLGRAIARFIRDEAGLNVIILDSNARQIRAAQEEGLEAVCGDAMDVSITEERPDFQKVRYLLAITDNTELNELLCHRWGDVLGRDRVHRWSAVKGDKAQSDLTHGTVVLPDLPHPSIAGDQLRSEHAELVTITVASGQTSVPGQVLMLARPGHAFPTSAGSSESLLEGDRLLVLRRDTGHLAAAFDAGDVMDFVTQDPREVFTQVERSLRQRFEALKDEALWNVSEESGSNFTRLGPGAALAHTYSSTLKQHVCLLARCADGLIVRHRAEKLRLLFFLVSPENDPSGHLATLAQLARFCSTSGNIQALLKFGKPSEALSFLRTQSGSL